jgi:hypothetical protein
MQDGFAGNNRIAGNLVFGMVRETVKLFLDLHGCYCRAPVLPMLIPWMLSRHAHTLIIISKYHVCELTQLVRNTGRPRTFQ